METSGMKQIIDRLVNQLGEIGTQPRQQYSDIYNITKLDDFKVKNKGQIIVITLTDFRSDSHYEIKIQYNRQKKLFGGISFQRVNKIDMMSSGLIKNPSIHNKDNYPDDNLDTICHDNLETICYKILAIVCIGKNNYFDDDIWPLVSNVY